MNKDKKNWLKDENQVADYIISNESIGQKNQNLIKTFWKKSKKIMKLLADRCNNSFDTALEREIIASNGKNKKLAILGIKKLGGKMSGAAQSVIIFNCNNNYKIYNEMIEHIGEDMCEFCIATIITRGSIGNLTKLKNELYDDLSVTNKSLLDERIAIARNNPSLQKYRTK